MTKGKHRHQSNATLFHSQLNLLRSSLKKEGVGKIQLRKLDTSLSGSVCLVTLSIKGLLPSEVVLSLLYKIGYASSLVICLIFTKSHILDKFFSHLFVSDKEVDGIFQVREEEVLGPSYLTLRRVTVDLLWLQFLSFPLAFDELEVIWLHISALINESELLFTIRDLDFPIASLSDLLLLLPQVVLTLLECLLQVSLVPFQGDSLALDNTFPGGRPASRLLNVLHWDVVYRILLQ